MLSLEYAHKGNVNGIALIFYCGRFTRTNYISAFIAGYSPLSIREVASSFGYRTLSSRFPSDMLIIITKEKVGTY